MALLFNNTDEQVNRDFVGNGVLNTADFPLAFPEQPDMTFDAGEGVAWVDGVRVQNDATSSVVLTIEAAESDPRIDIVQIGYNVLDGLPVLTVKQGVAAATPVEPDADARCIKLYAVNVAANAASIAEGDVEDRRELVPMKLTAAQIEGAAALGGNTFSDVQKAPTFTATSGEAPLVVPQLTAVPEAVGVQDTLCVVDGKWYISTGDEWKAMAEAYVPAPATADQLGNVMIGSGLNVDEQGVISVNADPIGQGDNTFTGVQTAPTFAATSGEAPLVVPQLAAVPEAVGAQDTLCVVDGKWYISTGTEWKEMAKGSAQTPATADQLGSVMIGSGLNVDEQGVISVDADPIGQGDNTFSGVQTAAGFVATSEDAPLQLPNLTELPATVAESGTLCIVNSALYISDGTEWVELASDELLPATATRLGGVKIGEGINVAADGTIDIVSTVLEPFRREQINFIDLAIEVETLKTSTLNGVTANIFIETFKDLKDILLLHGSHDSTLHKVYLV